MSEAPPIALAVVICTFRRPELLRAALASLQSQDIPAGASVTIYVVDNSDEGSAAPIFAAMQDGAAIPIVTVAAHPANISVARNAGIAASREPWLAFIDDDQACEPGWLAAVIAAARTTDKDALFGRVVGLFETPALASDAVRQLFSREIDADTGLELYAFGPQKIGRITLATNNSIFRRATTLTDAQPFEPSFGHGGGEDYDLFCRLQTRGRRFGWLPEAAVTEFVPESRCDDLYLRRRFYAGGQAFAAAMARASANPGRTRWILRLKAVAQMALLLAKSPALLTADAKRRADYGYRLAGILGKLSFGTIYPIYRQ